MKIIKLLTFISFMLLPLTIESHSLKGAINSKERDPKNALRDEYRNPYETLTFFKIESDMTVVELSPGGGWYTEILANYLHDPGYLIAAHFDPNSERSYFKKSRANFEKKLSSKPMYESVKLVNLFSNLADDNSVDAVLTFRNLHNWLGSNMDIILSNSFKALKPGGILGIVEHRAKPGTSFDDMKKSGYVSEDYAIKIAEKNGFKFVAKSEINANYKDSTAHPRGVWTLPPVMRLKDEDREKYLAIGESDRMTLLFVKPE